MSSFSEVKKLLLGKLEKCTVFRRKIIVLNNCLMLDQDEAGENATKNILSRLARRIFLRVIELPSEGDQADKFKGVVVDDLLRDI